MKTVCTHLLRDLPDDIGIDIGIDLAMLSTCFAVGLGGLISLLAF